MVHFLDTYSTPQARWQPQVLENLRDFQEHIDLERDFRKDVAYDAVQPVTPFSLRAQKVRARFPPLLHVSRV